MATTPIQAPGWESRRLALIELAETGPLGISQLAIYILARELTARWMYNSPTVPGFWGAETTYGNHPAFQDLDLHKGQDPTETRYIRPPWRLEEVDVETGQITRWPLSSPRVPAGPEAAARYALWTASGQAAPPGGYASIGAPRDPAKYAAFVSQLIIEADELLAGPPPEPED